MQVIVELIHGGRSSRPFGAVADTWLDDVTWSLSRQCTAIDPDARPTIGDIVANLRQMLTNS